MDIARGPVETERLRRWHLSPTTMVRELFGVEPDLWQADVLDQFPHRQRIALKAAKGVGKTTTLAWLIWNFMLTRPQPKVAVTSISADNLADTLWTELSHWYGRSLLLQAAFEVTKTRIFARSHPETWWASARTWSKGADRQQQSGTLSGLHADYILFILDESGGIPDAVMASAEAALSTCVEGHIVQSGNPTHLEGPLYRACTSERALWHVVEVTGDPDDPRRSPRVSAQWAREQIAKYGKDNAWVAINVYGRFPAASLNSLIGPDEVREAMGRVYREAEYGDAARVIGVDNARYGDDSTVIAMRQGLVAFQPRQMRNIDGTQCAGLIARLMQDWDADACFVDDTGGYGASTIDNLIRLGRSPIGVPFSGRADDGRYFNRRAEMYFLMVDWIRRGGRLPDIPELLSALTQLQYSFQGDRLLLESKEQLKQRLGFSPDHADAMALTFAAPVVRRGYGARYGHREAASCVDEAYTPFASAYAAALPEPARRGVWAGLGSWDG